MPILGIQLRLLLSLLAFFSLIPLISAQATTITPGAISNVTSYVTTVLTTISPTSSGADPMTTSVPVTVTVGVNETMGGNTTTSAGLGTNVRIINTQNGTLSVDTTTNITTVISPLLSPSNNTASSFNVSTVNTTLYPYYNYTSYPTGTLIYPPPNSTVLFPNATLFFPLNSTYLLPNGTLLSSNFSIIPDASYEERRKQWWNESNAAGGEYLPFQVRLDAAYGVAGGWLMLTGVPVGVMGGKNRW